MTARKSRSIFCCFATSLILVLRFSSSAADVELPISSTSSRAVITRIEIPSTTIAAKEIVLAGFYSPGDLGTGAIYVSRNASPSGPMAIRDAAGTWFNLVVSHTVDVGFFGARADGASDDAAAIQSAVNSGAPRVRLAAGTSVVHQGIWLPSNIELFGGKGSIILVKANSNAINIVGKSNVSVHDLEIDGDVSRTRSTENNAVFVDWRSAPGHTVEIRNVKVLGAGGSGIQILASARTPSRDVRIESNDISDVGAHGVVVQDHVSDVTISRNVVKDWGLLHPDRIGIVGARHGSNVMIDHNIVTGSAAALGTSAHGISLDGARYVTCHTNIVSDVIGYGIEIGGVDNGVISANVVHHTKRAAIALSGSNASRFSNSGVVVAENVLSSGENDGIYSFVAEHNGSDFQRNITIHGNSIRAFKGFGIDLQAADSVVIGNNLIANNSLGGILTVGGTNILISNNSILNNNVAIRTSISSSVQRGRTIIASTDSAHGFRTGDIITILAKASQHRIVAPITVMSPTSFAYEPGADATPEAVSTPHIAIKSNNLSYGGIKIVDRDGSNEAIVAVRDNLVYANGFRDLDVRQTH